MDYIQGCLLLFLINSSICIEDDQESKKDGAPYCDPFLSHVNNRVHDYVIHAQYYVREFHVATTFFYYNHALNSFFSHYCSINFYQACIVSTEPDYGSCPLFVPYMYCFDPSNIFDFLDVI
jgi:hypothetical protein